MKYITVFKLPAKQRKAFCKKSSYAKNYKHWFSLRIPLSKEKSKLVHLETFSFNI